MSETRGPKTLADAMNSHEWSPFKKRLAPPISCICTPRYYAGKSLLNRSQIRLF
jgi:hypothetical protein